MNLIVVGENKTITSHRPISANECICAVSSQSLLYQVSKYLSQVVLTIGISDWLVLLKPCSWIWLSRTRIGTVTLLRQADLSSKLSMTFLSVLWIPIPKTVFRHIWLFGVAVAMLVNLRVLGENRISFAGQAGRSQRTQHISAPKAVNYFFISLANTHSTQCYLSQCWLATLVNLIVVGEKKTITLHGQISANECICAVSSQSLLYQVSKNLFQVVLTNGISDWLVLLKPC